MDQSTDEFITRWRAHSDDAQRRLLLETAEELRRRQRWRHLSAFGRMLNPLLAGPIIFLAVLYFGFTKAVMVLLWILGYLAIYLMYNWAHAHQLRTNMLLRRQGILADLPGRSEDSLRSALRKALPFVLLLRDFRAAQEPHSATSTESAYRPIIKDFGDDIETALPSLIPDRLKIVALHNARDWSGGVDDDRYRYILCSDASFAPTVARLTDFAEGVFVVQRGNTVSSGLMEEINILIALKVLRKAIVISHNTIQFNEATDSDFALHISQYDLYRSLDREDIRIALTARIAAVIATANGP